MRINLGLKFDGGEPWADQIIQNDNFGKRYIHGTPTLPRRRGGWLCPGVAKDSRCVHEFRVQTMGAAPAIIERYKNICACS